MSITPLERISKILVPVDGSESSMRAAGAAIELASRYSSIGTSASQALIEVVALHVVDTSPKFELFAK
jgi:nucleotide-binding universal stress UspA family protein